MPFTFAVLLAAALGAGQLAEGLTWRNIGPAITGGRIDDIAVDASHPDTIYVGAATGGVWKTVNGGATWTPIFDDFGTTSIGAVAVSRSNPNVVWVGTGEPNNRQSSSWGNGVYRSDDGGATWQAMGLRDTKHIGRIVVHPANPNIVYVAALGHLFGPNRERGLFKTVDGGRTWTNTKFIDENTGFVDVAMDPRDPDTLYAAAYQRQRKAYGFNGGGPGSGLYKTTNGGRTWTRIEGGLPSGIVGRIAIAIARSNPKVVYVTYEHKEGGVFRSVDRGRTWRRVNALQPRPLYFSQIRVDPKDEQRVYVLGTSLFVSDDGGQTFRSDGARNVHVDHHALWIDPSNPSVIWLGNDGGIWVSRDRSVTWTRVNNVPLAQIYGVALDNRDPYYVYAGLQDNGVWSGPSATRHRVGPLNDDWIQVGGGDGMMAATPADEASRAYVEMQDGRVLRFNPFTGENKSLRPFVKAPTGAAAPREGEANPDLRFNWTTPIAVSTHDPETVYVAGHRLWRSTDGGERWSAISPDLTKHLDRDKMPIMGVAPGADMLGRNDGITAYGTATAFAESPARAGLLAAGTDDGLVQLSNDGGTTWDDVTPRIPNAPEGAWVSAIVLSHASPDRMYVAFDNHRNDDYAPYLYASDDGGRSWRVLTNGLRADAPVRALREDPRRPDVLFAGSESGLSWSLDRGRNWLPLKNALPDVPVFDIAIAPRLRELVVATHGRGIYVMNISRLESAGDAAAAAEMFDIQPVTTFNVLEHRDFLAQSTYVGANPPRAAAIDYALNDAATDVKLRIEGADGRIAREIDAPLSAGVHRVEWDLRLAPPPQPKRQPPAAGVLPGDPRPAESTRARIPGDFGGGGDPTGGEAGAPPEPLRGPVVPPGTYRATLVVGGHDAASRTFQVEGDPRVRISEEDQRARWAFLTRVYDAQVAAIPTANSAIDMRDQANAVAKTAAATANGGADLKKFADETVRLVREAQARMARVTQQLGAAGRDVSGSTSRPTDAQEQQLAAALAELEPAAAAVKDLQATRMPELTRRARPPLR